MYSNEVNESDLILQAFGHLVDYTFTSPVEFIFSCILASALCFITGKLLIYILGIPKHEIPTSSLVAWSLLSWLGAATLFIISFVMFLYCAVNIIYMSICKTFNLEWKEIE